MLEGCGKPPTDGVVPQQILLLDTFCKGLVQPLGGLFIGAIRTLASTSLVGKCQWRSCCSGEVDAFAAHALSARIRSSDRLLLAARRDGLRRSHQGLRQPARLGGLLGQAGQVKLPQV